MEFVCVLSIEGTLVSYMLTREAEDRYRAHLKSSGMPGLPDNIVLEKKEGQWRTEPWHPDIINSLIHCIEAVPVSTE
jgi:hypothetical protein